MVDLAPGEPVTLLARVSLFPTATQVARDRKRPEDTLRPFQQFVNVTLSMPEGPRTE